MATRDETGRTHRLAFALNLSRWHPAIPLIGRIFKYVPLWPRRKSPKHGALVTVESHLRNLARCAVHLRPGDHLELFRRTVADEG